jgi:hypothetical protein
MRKANGAGGVLVYLSVSTSLSTLLCCALPSFFVLLGLGATVASVVSRRALADLVVSPQGLDVCYCRLDDCG